MSSTKAALSARYPKLAFTYGLNAIENSFELLYPFAIGFAINGLLADKPLTLVPLLLIWLAHTASGYFRQRFDTRLFTEIYAELAAKIAIDQREQGTTTSDIAARTDMVEELVEFMEEDIPALMMALFGLVGGAVMLFFYDWLAGLIMSVVLLPAALIYWRFGHRVQRLERRFNNRAEREVSVIHRGNSGSLRRHFLGLARWRVMVSDSEARSWSSLELISLLLFVAVLIRLTAIDSMLAGDIFAAVAYALSMLTAMDALPGIVSALGRMWDNVSRFN